MVLPPIRTYWEKLYGAQRLFVSFSHSPISQHELLPVTVVHTGLLPKPCLVRFRKLSSQVCLEHTSEVKLLVPLPTAFACLLLPTKTPAPNSPSFLLLMSFQAPCHFFFGFRFRGLGLDHGPCSGFYSIFGILLFGSDCLNAFETFRRLQNCSEAKFLGKEFFFVCLFSIVYC